MTEIIQVLLNVWPFLYLVLLVAVPVLLILICWRLFRKSAERRKAERMYNGGKPFRRERIEQMSGEERKELLLLLLKL